MPVGEALLPRHSQGCTALQNLRGLSFSISLLLRSRLSQDRGLEETLRQACLSLKSGHLPYSRASFSVNLSSTWHLPAHCLLHRILEGIVSSTSGLLYFWRGVTQFFFNIPTTVSSSFSLYCPSLHPLYPQPTICSSSVSVRKGQASCGYQQKSWHINFQ